MDLHLLELFRGQLAGLGDNVLGNGQFADIMQQSRGAQRFNLLVIDFELLGNLNRVDADALQVIVRVMVFRLDGQCQSFNCAQVERRHVFDVAFLVLEASEIETVRAEDPVDHRQD